MPLLQEMNMTSPLKAEVIPISLTATLPKKVMTRNGLRQLLDRGLQASQRTRKQPGLFFPWLTDATGPGFFPALVGLGWGTADPPALSRGMAEATTWLALLRGVLMLWSRKPHEHVLGAMTCSSMIPGFHGTEYSAIRSFSCLVFALQIGLRHFTTVPPPEEKSDNMYLVTIGLLSFMGTPPGTKMIG
ncbi:hypothetical protein BO78DRAFT_62330 [Aspergillus sclerotiicarbonarius CBS 121057]|uniref:Uncharacterized protein n=1 Tax=Aspergillus sclerotiicarbonarius (strain CBS 121057 / IBT 28362) TaxID=1448318 RepID=A0A319FNI8_ASPSB|nr:hypothetical protein BO78DRAFT_62330 [Aspergillus sclerotiicarbonarius CBS 121057]